MRKVIFLLLIFISLLVLVLRLGGGPVAKFLGIQQRAGLRVDAAEAGLVSIDKKQVGSTPWQDENLSVDDHLVEITAEGSQSARLWQGVVKLNEGTLAVVNRDLGDDQAHSSGEVITLEPGKGAVVISNPTGSDVEIDGKMSGKTPLSVGDLVPGEHMFVLSHSNYLKRSLRVNLADNFLININVDLAVSEPDLTNVAVAPISANQRVIVKKTPTNFLRVRAEANQNSIEVERVLPGDSLVLLEELPNWDRVRLADGKEGYVSSSFVDKKVSP